MAQDCCWGSARQVQILKAIVSPELQDPFRGAESIDFTLEALIKKYYHPTKIDTFYQKLHTTRQENFNWIEAYYRTVKNLVEEISACKGCYVDNQEKIEEYFYMGLTTETSIDIARLNLRSLKEIIEKVSEIEEIKKKHTPTSQRRYSSKNEPQNNNKKFYAKMWCPYHKTANHDKSSCRKLNGQKQQRKDENKTFAIKETKIQAKPIILKGKIRDIECDYLLDTGSVKNYMSSKFQEKHNLEISESPEFSAEMANQNLSKVSQAVYAEINFLNIPN